MANEPQRKAFTFVVEIENTPNFSLEETKSAVVSGQTLNIIVNFLFMNISSKSKVF